MTVSSPITGTLAANFAGALRAAAEQAPNRPAIITSEEQVIYRELWERSASFANQLLAEGLRPGDRVGIFFERGASQAVAYFGTLAAGGVAVIINESLRPRQIEEILARSGAGFLVASPELLQRQPRAPYTDARIVELVRPSPRSGTGAHPSCSPLDLDSRTETGLAQIIFTSGSTGRPKGVMVSHQNLWAAVDAVAAYLGIEEDDRVASLLPFSSVYGLNQLLCAIYRAATLVVATSPVANEVAAALRRKEATVAAAVPPLWLQLLAAPSFTSPPIASLRILQNAGGHLPVPAVRRLRALYPDARLFLQYGLTEVFRSTYLPPEEVDRRPDSIGRAIPGAEILVLRDDLTPCAPGEVGELVHRGPTVALGYWDDQDATALVFRPDPAGAVGGRVVFSGDLVRTDGEGFLYFVGRRDRIIKTLGYRVGPDEVAGVLYASGEVVDALVAGEPDPLLGERIVAYVALAEGGSLYRLQKFCRAELPSHMQPARFVTLPSLPRTSSGKYDLLAIRALENHS